MSFDTLRLPEDSPISHLSLCCEEVASAQDPNIRMTLHEFAMISDIPAALPPFPHFGNADIFLGTYQQEN